MRQSYWYAFDSVAGSVYQILSSHIRLGSSHDIPAMQSQTHATIRQLPLHLFPRSATGWEEVPFSKNRLWYSFSSLKPSGNGQIRPTACLASPPCCWKPYRPGRLSVGKTFIFQSQYFSYLTHW
jgi:hypothetical protein